MDLLLSLPADAHLRAAPLWPQPRRRRAHRCALERAANARPNHPRRSKLRAHMGVAVAPGGLRRVLVEPDFVGIGVGVCRYQPTEGVGGSPLAKRSASC